jgi:hypothetical protein
MIGVIFAITLCIGMLTIIIGIIHQFINVMREMRDADRYSLFFVIFVLLFFSFNAAIFSSYHVMWFFIETIQNAHR